MTKNAVDVAIVGGGLAGGLIALALHRASPGTQIALIEKGDTLGGNHRWSWFSSDLDAAGTALLDEFDITRWDTGYDVHFPNHSRHLPTGYRSLSSRDFAARLSDILPASAIRLNCTATALHEKGVTLDNGDAIEARIVIDCRPFAPSPHLEGGWQVFLGSQIRHDNEHGLKRPIVMDAKVDQLAPRGNGGAYRFVYSLPLNERDIFVEDTYYADDPALDRDVLNARVAAYCAQKKWAGTSVSEEVGVLPVITGGNFSAYLGSIRIPGVAIAGARGGFTHPLTSYTVPIAINNALFIADVIRKDTRMSGAQFAEIIERRARAHWRQSAFYRMLGRMLFGAAEPHRRVTIFELFYRRPLATIERFYRVQTSLFDRLRILSGKPPVSIPNAIRAISSKGKPLAHNADIATFETGEPL